MLLYLLSWITALGGYPDLLESAKAVSPEELPGVVYLQSRTLLTVCSYGQASQDELDNDLVRESLLGCYVPVNNTIYVKDHPTLGINTNLGQTVMLHELVHFLQHRYWNPGGRDAVGIDEMMPVMSSLEAEAYEVGEIYSTFMPRNVYGEPYPAEYYESEPSLESDSEPLESECEQEVNE